MKIKKRPKHDRYERLELRKAHSHEIYKKQYISVLQKYELACQVGSNKIFYVKVVSKAGQTKFDRRYPEVDMRARIIRLVNDKYYRMGMLALTDE